MMRKIVKDVTQDAVHEAVFVVVLALALDVAMVDAQDSAVSTHWPIISHGSNLDDSGGGQEKTTDMKNGAPNESPHRAREKQR